MKSKTRMRVNENGRVVIPASFRQALGINIGDEVILRIVDDELRVTTLRRRLQRAQRLVRKHVKPTTSLVDELIAERHEAAGNEDRGGRFRSARSTESGSWGGKTDARTLERSRQ
jgi:AbrB family looped-hinge helix DNA binding protein